MNRITRHAWLAIAPAFALLLYWRVPITWFVNDDFAWLGLPLEVHHARDLLSVLFAPRAQGTVRFLGERLFFLVFSSSSDSTRSPITSSPWPPGAPISSWPRSSAPSSPNQKPLVY